MNSNKRLYLIGFLVLAIVAILYVSMMERRDIPDVNLKKKYESQDKNPYGLYLFEELVATAFPDADRILEDKLSISDYIETENVLYIWLSERVGLDENDRLAVDSFLQAGNELLLISNTYKGELDSVLVSNDVMTYMYYDTSIAVNWGAKYDTLYQDTIFTFVNEDLETPTKGSYNVFSSYWSEDTLHQVEPQWLVSFWEEEWMYGRLQVSDSTYIHAHTSPILFTNLSLKQTEGFDYLLKILSQFDPKTVVIDSHAENRKIWVNPNDTPLTFIMSQPPLKWTYYLILAGLMLFIIYQSGRKQRIIPVIAPYKNTSLDHVEMIAELYGSQRRHGQLIHHMESWFYHVIKRRYFIDAKDVDFTSKLAVKSKVPKEEVEIIINRFSRIRKSREVSADDLRVFYKSLERFYERCK